MDGENLEAESERAPKREGTEKSERLEGLEHEFVRGNYRLVREGAKALLRSENPAEVRRARDLLAKTSPDPWFLGLIGLSFVFFFAIAFYVYAVGR